MFAGLLLLILRYWRRHKQQLLLICLVTGVLALIAFISWLILPGVEGDLAVRSHLILERISALFSGSDPSVQGRLELLGQGLHLLERHWLLGYFMNEVVEIGKGAYIHNWLSFWLAYGIGPFLLAAWLILSLMARSWRQREKSHMALLTFCLLTFVLLEIILARSYIWPYFCFGLGFAVTILSDNRKERLHS